MSGSNENEDYTEDSLITELNKVCIEGYSKIDYKEKLVWLEKCDGIIKKLRIKQAERTFSFKLPTKKENKENLTELEDWLSNNDIDMSNTSLFESKKFQCNGVKCKKTLKQGECVFKVPEKLFISASGFLKSSSFWTDTCESQKLFSLSMSQTILSLALLKERILGKGSFFASYVKILPQTFPNLPIFWDTSKLSYILETSAEIAIKRRYECLLQYCEIFGFLERSKKEKKKNLPFLVRKLEYFTLDNFLWAVGITTTRQNNINVPPSSSSFFETKKNFGLVPLLDMCNHEQGIISSGCEISNNKILVVCKAHRDFHEGEEIGIFYGERSNTELFVYSGFIPDLNTFDSISIDLYQSYIENKLYIDENEIDESLDKMRHIFFSTLFKENFKFNCLLTNFELRVNIYEQIYPLVKLFLQILYLNKDRATEMLKSLHSKENISSINKLFKVKDTQINEYTVLNFLVENVSILLKDTRLLLAERYKIQPDSLERNLVISLLQNQIIMLEKCFLSLKIRKEVAKNLHDQQ